MRQPRELAQRRQAVLARQPQRLGHRQRCERIGGVVQTRNLELGQRDDGVRALRQRDFPT
jgi:hypothetical protein